jgi:hypothetical protein
MNRAVAAAFAAVCLPPQNARAFWGPRGILRIMFALCLFALLWMPAKAQTATTTSTAPVAETPTSPNGNFSLTAQAVALPGGGQTVAGTIVGFTKSITNTVSLRNDDLLAPGSNFQGYFGGAQWFPNVSKQLAKTKLTGLQPYITGSVGIDRIVPSSGASQQHIAFLAGGGLNYTPASGPTINLFEVRYARLPGLANNTAVVSSGFTISF